MPLIGDSIAASTANDGSQSAASKAKLDDDLNKFLNLLVTQLKNQDPLDPMDATEFTSQLVQFASVEQQIFQNTNLEKLLQLQETNQVSNLVDLIGNIVETEGRQVPLVNSKAEFTYTMPAGANKATITITNSNGLTVFTGDADTTAGKNTFSWNGKSTSGVQQDDGAYNVLVSGTDFQGNLLEISHTVFGRVTGVGIDNGVLALNLGDEITYGQDKVLSVKEAVTP